MESLADQPDPLRRDELLQRVIRAQEAIEDGDSYYALGILQQLEVDLSPTRPTARCDRCGTRFEWPGLLQAHRDRSGHGLAETA